MNQTIPAPHHRSAPSVIAGDAAQLMREFGEAAGDAAALRAACARRNDNAVRFAHWRGVERLVALLGDADPGGSRH